MKESAESHDTIMTAGTILSAFPKADKTPVNQQGEIHVPSRPERLLYEVLVGVTACRQVAGNSFGVVDIN